jgi:hypothetical protein
MEKNEPDLQREYLFFISDETQVTVLVSLPILVKLQGNKN